MLASVYLLAGCGVEPVDTASGPEPVSSTAVTATTYNNPVLPGDHPDMNIFREGNDYYLTGSSFNMTPNVEILHSKDLVHWERVSRVVDPAWSGLASSQAGQGTWGGFIVKSGGFYWVYFAVNFSQFFSRATSLAGPWSTPVAVNGRTGYDDSVFVDDDGKIYMLMKSGHCSDPGFNAIQQIGANGQLTGSLIDLSFVNNGDGGCPDWAEGPSMTKRNGFYYYFVSTHTGCGSREVVWRSRTLTSNPSSWVNLGTVLQAPNPFAGSQHSTAPFQIADGTWWAFYHSYECAGGWGGLGRQGLLSQVTWQNDVPVVAPAPLTARAPALAAGGIPFLLPVNDEFASSPLKPAWTFYGPTPAARYSVTDRPGWLRVKPASGQTTHVVQKAALHSNAMVARIAFTPQVTGDAAGVRLGNANNTIDVSVARVWSGGDRIRFGAGSTSTLVASPAASVLWLKLVVTGHRATGWFSIDRLSWTQVGAAIDITALDQFNTINNGWVGNQAGVFASNRSADFDLFAYRDGFTEIPASEPNQWSGTSVVSSSSVGPVLGSLENGDWAMYGSVDLGSGGIRSKAIELRASAAGPGGTVNVWTDPLATTPIASCPIAGTGSWDSWRTVSCNLTATGSHDVYLTISGGAGELLRLASLRFVPGT
jgi:beta-xylosidase